VENLSIIEVNPDQVKEKLASTFPELTGIQVSVALPNAVTVTAAERQPVLAIAKGDRVSWVDDSGVIFPARGDAGKLITIQAENDLPLASAPIDPTQFATQEAASAGGSASAQPARNPVPVTSVSAAGQQRIDPNLLVAAEGLSQKLPEGTLLVYSKENGLGWKAPEGWQVYIGTDLSDFEAKYATYQHLASYLAAQGITPSLISAERLDAPYYRLGPAAGTPSDVPEQ
jgi:hypothetical protein